MLIKHKKSEFYAIASLALAMLLSSSILISCKDDKPKYEPEIESVNRSIFLGAASSIVTLPELDADIKSIENDAKWLTVTDNGLYDNLVRSVKVDIADYDESESGQTANVKIRAGDKLLNLSCIVGTVALPPDENSGGNTAFISDWENQDTVTLTNIDRTRISVRLPWASLATTQLPNEIAKDVSKAEGWRMAFSLLDEPCENYHYFGLYNKHLGILRVFYYLSNLTSQGGEWSFSVTPFTGRKNELFPFYNSLQYGIPVCHTNMNGKTNPTTLNVNTFQNYITPYSHDGKPTVKEGWTAFDVDMSAYKPDFSLDVNNGLQFVSQSVVNASVTLSGAMAGKIGGTFSQTTKASTSSANGLNAWSNMNSLTSGIGGLFSAFTSTPPDYGKMAVNGLSSVYNAYKYFAGETTDDSQTQSTSEGKISMDLTGTIDLTGFITAKTSNSGTDIIMDFSHFITKNDVGLGDYAATEFGHGVWSLQNDPVVYIVKDRIVGSQSIFNFRVEGNGKYSVASANPADKNLRIISFLDPQSLKLNLNTNSAKEISDVNLHWYYGVYPNADTGHTNNYRVGLLNLSDAGVANAGVPIVHKDSAAAGTYCRSSSPIKGQIPYVKQSRKSLAYNDYSTDAVWLQKGAKYSYYGHCPYPTSGAKDPQAFIIDPQVSLPGEFINNVGTVYDPQVPDFVVCVIVSYKFTDDEGKTHLAVFSKRFLPDVKTITMNELKAKKTEIAKYINDCNGKNPIQTVNGIGVTHSEGHTGYSQMQRLYNNIDKIN